MRYQLVIPCFNEANRLQANKFLKFVNTHSSAHLLFVDDGSTDATAETLERLSRANDQIRFIKLERNVGKAEAIRQGMLHTRKEDFEFIGYWDADQPDALFSAENFATCLNKNPQLKLVMGARIKRLGADVKRKWYRHYLGRCFATTVSILLRLGVYDTQSGAKLFRKIWIEPAFSKPFMSRWIFDVEILHRLQCGKPKTFLEESILEYPLEHWSEIDGSKIRATDFLKAPWSLFRIFTQRPYEVA